MLFLCALAISVKAQSPTQNYVLTKDVLDVDGTHAITTVIDININPTLSQLGAAEAFSHEGYGHAYIYVTTNGDRYKAVHHFDGNIETNGYLKECSIKARKETVKNFAK